MSQLLELLFFIFLGWLLYKLVNRGIAIYRMTRPLRDAHKAFRQARRQYERQGEQTQTQRKSAKFRKKGGAFMREYAEDVEFVEISETTWLKDKSKTAEQKVVIENQVTDVEWEEVKK